MNPNEKDQNKPKNENTTKNMNEGTKLPKGEKVDNEKIMKGEVPGAPSQKSGSRGSADVQDGGQDMGSSAGSH
jgi:hypothetical protein